MPVRHAAPIKTEGSQPTKVGGAVLTEGHFRVAALPKNRLWQRLMPMTTFILVMTLHALYIRLISAAPTDSDGFADSGITDSAGFLGLGPYWAAQDYYLGFSYALGAAFAVWATVQFVRTRQAAMAAGAVGSVTLVGVLMAGGCFLLGCCGSPMLGVYLALFGAKFLGAGKPLMALVTLLSVGCGCWCLSRRFVRGGCAEGDCKSGC